MNAENYFFNKSYKAVKYVKGILYWMWMAFLILVLSSEHLTCLWLHWNDKQGNMLNKQNNNKKKKKDFHHFSGHLLL